MHQVRAKQGKKKNRSPFFLQKVIEGCKKFWLYVVRLFGPQLACPPRKTIYNDRRALLQNTATSIRLEPPPCPPLQINTAHAENRDKFRSDASGVTPSSLAHLFLEAFVMVMEQNQATPALLPRPRFCISQGLPLKTADDQQQKRKAWL